MLFVLMANLSAQTATHVVNLLLASMAAAHFQMPSAVVMESIAVHMDTHVMLQMELVVERFKEQFCCIRYQFWRGKVK